MAISGGRLVRGQTSAELLEEMRFAAPRFTVDQQTGRATVLADVIENPETFREDVPVDLGDVNAIRVPGTADDRVAKGVHTLSLLKVREKVGHQIGAGPRRCSNGRVRQ